MNTRDLQYILAVAELRSFSKAATVCHVSQSTMSGQIKKQEEQLGIQIFERSQRRVIPTDAGQQVIESAARIVAELDRMKELASQAHDPMSGRFRIGAFPSLASYAFADLVTAVTAELPNLRLVLVEEKTDRLLEMLDSGELDAALLAQPVHHDALIGEPLFSEPFYVAMPEAHPLAGYAQISTEKLANYPLLLLEEGHCFRDQALDVCQQHGMRVEQDVRATGLETLRQMVRAGTGITLMPEIAVQRDDSGLLYRPLAEPTPSREIAFFTRKTNSERPLVRRLREILTPLWV